MGNCKCSCRELAGYPAAHPWARERKYVIIADDLMQNCKLKRAHRILEEMLRRVPQLSAACRDSDTIAVDFLAFGECPMSTSSHISVRGFLYSSKNDRALMLAVALLIRYAAGDTNLAFLLKLEHALSHCDSARVQAEALLLMGGTEAWRYRASSEASLGKRRAGARSQASLWDSMFDKIDKLDLSHLQRAQNSIPEHIAVENHEHYQVVHEALQELVDDWKRKVLQSFLESTKLYLGQVYRPTDWEHGLIGDVEVHGISGWKWILEGIFDMALPIPALKDEFQTQKGCLDTPRGLTQEAWDLILKLENVGKSVEYCPSMRQLMAEKKVVKDSSYAEGIRGDTPGKQDWEWQDKKRFTSGTRKSIEAKVRRRSLDYIPVAERVAYLFSREVMVEKIATVPVAQSDNNEAYAGFRQACDHLFQQYKEVIPEAAETDEIMEYLRPENNGYRLDEERAYDFFRWLRVLKEDKHVLVRRQSL